MGAPPAWGPSGAELTSLDRVLERKLWEMTGPICMSQLAARTTAFCTPVVTVCPHPCRDRDISQNGFITLCRMRRRPWPTSLSAPLRTRGWRPGRVYFLTLLEPLRDDRTLALTARSASHPPP
jgi:hypothetical protein